MKMQIERFGKRLALEFPEEWVERYRLSDGVELDAAAIEAVLATRLKQLEDQRRRAIEEIKARAYPLPPDWKFDREEANWRPAMDRW